MTTTAKYVLLVQVLISSAFGAVPNAMLGALMIIVIQLSEINDKLGRVK